MTSFYPHTPYAEDQPNAHAILYTHTIRAGAMLGTFLAAIAAPTSLLISGYRYGTPFTRTIFLSRLLMYSGRGLVAGSVFGAVATYGRMRGLEEIEWQDRSWRLQESKSQNSADAVSLRAAAVGAVVGGLGARRGMGMSVGKGVLGGAGVGMGLGVWTMVANSDGEKDRS